MPNGIEPKFFSIGIDHPGLAEIFAPDGVPGSDIIMSENLHMPDHGLTKEAMAHSARPLDQLMRH